LLLGGLLGLYQAVAIALAVAELERILGGDLRADLLDRVRVEEALEPLARTHAHVVAALRAHVQVALEFRAIQHRVAGRALAPQPLRHRARPPLGLDARRHDLFEPGHRPPDAPR